MQPVPIPSTCVTHMKPNYSAFGFNTGSFSLKQGIKISPTPTNLCQSHRRTARRCTTHSLLPKPAVVFVTPDGFSQDHKKAERLAKKAVQGGVSLIQIRDVPASDQDILSVTRALLATGVPASKISLNGIHPSIVRDLSPDLGVHIRENKISEYLKEATQIMGPEALISCSIHSVESAMKTMAHDRPSYLQVGTMYPSTSHPDKIPEGLPVLRAVREAVGPSQMIIGIGGIKESNLADVIKNGADGVAVISSISRADDPSKATSELLALCQGAYANDA